MLLENRNAIIYGAGDGIGADVAKVATFLACDRAAGMTGAMTNVTSGLVLG